MARVRIAGGTGNTSGVVGRLRDSASSSPSSTGVGADTKRELERLQRAGGGLDFFGVTQPGAASYQEPLPGLDFRWTWQSKDRTQMGFELTINSSRAGLNLQRGRIEQGHIRLSQSSLITHAADQAVLPWDTVEQHIDIGTQPRGVFPAISSVMFKGRLVLGSPHAGTDGNLYAETSPSDPTLIETPIAANSTTQALYTITVNGQELLGVGNRLYSDLEGDLRALLPINPPEAVIQVPLPGDPLVIRAHGRTFLISAAQAVGDDPLTGGTPPYVMLNGLPRFSKAIGMVTLGGRPPRAYWMERNENDGSRNSKVTSTNFYGTDWQTLSCSLNGHLTGAAICRDGLLMTNTERVVFHNGIEHDLRIFADVKQEAGYFYYVAGIVDVDGAPFAEVNRVPIEYNAVFAIDAATSAPPSTLPVYRALWRYDFEIGQWSQVSEWTTWAASDHVTQYGRSPYSYMIDGHISAWCQPALPFSTSTRHFHIPSAAGSVNPVIRKYQEPSGTNPYGQRESDRDYAEEGFIDTPALLFPPGTEYMDKYLDAIEWGGQDTGGTGSKTTVWVAEGGRLDETDPAPLHAVFRKGLTHATRYAKQPTNQTSMLFPQVRIKVERGTEAEKTPQALPVTIHGHIDLPEEERPSWIPKWLGRFRSKG